MRIWLTLGQLGLRICIGFTLLLPGKRSGIRFIQKAGVLVRQTRKLAILYCTGVVLICCFCCFIVILLLLHHAPPRWCLLYKGSGVVGRLGLSFFYLSFYFLLWEGSLFNAIADRSGDPSQGFFILCSLFLCQVDAQYPWYKGQGDLVSSLIFDNTF